MGGKASKGGEQKPASRGGLFGMFNFSAAKANVLVVGLDNSGKTTIIEKLKPVKEQSHEVVPTVGFNVDKFTKGSISFTVFDMSGAGKYRNLWEQYFKDANAVIFVIDTSDALRMCVAKDELEQLLSNASLARTPVLFFANKMDLPSAHSPVDCTRALRLDTIKDRPWVIVGSNAMTGEGLDQGISWLADCLVREGKR